MTSSTPRISVGLPTYNRAASLRRAAESVLAQDYDDFELVISDNASTDATRELCEELAARDARIRYIRQPVNLGAVANFQAVLDAARGEFFMWLADDDWLDRGYLSRCLVALSESPDHVLVCGVAKYFRGEEFCLSEDAINLNEESGGERVLSYYKAVGFNGTFYGLMRRERLLLLNHEAILGGDWLLIARLAFLGKIRALEDTHINRSLAGASQDVERLARADGLTGFLSENPHLYIAYNVFRDIVWRCPVYRPLGLARRISLGAKAARSVAARYCFSRWRVVERWDAQRSRLTLRTRIKRALGRGAA